MSPLLSLALLHTCCFGVALLEKLPRAQSCSKERGSAQAGRPNHGCCETEQVVGRALHISHSGHRSKAIKVLHPPSPFKKTISRATKRWHGKCCLTGRLGELSFLLTAADLSSSLEVLQNSLASKGLWPGFQPRKVAAAATA